MLLMTGVETISRKTIEVPFSRELEYLLLQIPTRHASLTDDIEQCSLRGLQLVSELEDVVELPHTQQIRKLVEITNLYIGMDEEAFDSWNIAISENLVDELELLILTHGEELKELGLEKVSTGSVLTLTIVSGLFHEDFAEANQQVLAQLVQLR